MTEFLFLDLDDTILDFHKAERIALSKTLREFGVEPTEEVLALYHKINLWHWEQLEKGKLTRDEVQVGRFAALFRELGVSADALRRSSSLRNWASTSPRKNFLTPALPASRTLTPRRPSWWATA